MSTQTTNLHLVKPVDAEAVDVSVINANMDTIDTAIKNLQDSVALYGTYEITVPGNDTRWLCNLGSNILIGWRLAGTNYDHCYCLQGDNGNVFIANVMSSSVTLTVKIYQYIIS